LIPFEDNFIINMCILSKKSVAFVVNFVEGIEKKKLIETTGMANAF